MNNLVIGMGQIGKAVHSMVVRSGNTYAHDTDVKDPLMRPPADGQEFDVMHICFPYTKHFIGQVNDYLEQFPSKHVIIWSTVPIGTSAAINDRVVHTPVEGVHPNLSKSIELMTRWIGYNDGAEGRFFTKYFRDLGLVTESVHGTNTTELLKMRSTAKYGVNLAWANYEQELCDKFGVSYDRVMEFDKNYNELYRQLGLEEFQRYILFPVDGKIGGHCVVPNAELLNQQYPSKLLDEIIALGESREPRKET